MKIKNHGGSKGGVVVHDRWRNTIGEIFPIPDEENPLLLPPPETVVWHYIRFKYFQNILDSKALYFTRLDKQSDKMDGRYTKENMHDMSPLTKALLKPYGIEKGSSPSQLENINNRLRKKTYIHCWSIRARESAWMWNTFLKDEVRSIAIKSTVGRLMSALLGQPVGFKKIIYYPVGVPRPDWAYSAPFSTKDGSRYAREKELRLIFTHELGVIENVEHKLFKTNVQELVSRIAVHPLSSSDFQSEVRVFLKSHGFHFQVSKSSLQVSDLKAVARTKGNGESV